MDISGEYYAHINENTGQVQTVKQHCENVASMAENFVIQPFKTLAYDIGLYHDVGKYQPSFQRRIRNADIRVDHSTSGAIASEDFQSNTAILIAEYCIAGHHAGIPDGGRRGDSKDVPTLYGRLRKDCEDYSEYKNELTIHNINDKELTNFVIQDCENSKQGIDKFAFIVRYIFSALVDADSLDTESFCNGTKRKSLKSDFKACEEKLQEKFASFEAKTDLQKARARVQAQAYSNIAKDADIYLMNMPTGSGKTLCSISCALSKAIQERKKRIIYVIPYNSIISQTAETFQDIFGNSASILRHQSTYSSEDKDQRGKDYRLESEEYRLQLKQATENWDADLIITTSVQFFESIYSNKRGKLRKLHNMADSILIFDEIHMMPKENLQPCLEAVAYITRYLNSKAFFLTATMPDFKSLLKKYTTAGIHTTDLITDTSDFGYFKRCEYEDIGAVNEDDLISDAGKHASALIILNSRQETKKLYLLSASVRKFHLSTYMTARDRQNTITAIKDALKDMEIKYSNLQSVPEEERVIVFSTSLIEAGVDLDFDAVYRELSGLDDILQSGGRCNREGKRKGAQTYIFEIESEGAKKPVSDDRGEITRGLLQRFREIDDPACIREYYNELYYLHEDELTENAMYNFPCDDLRSIPFSSYNFKMINQESVSVVIGQDDESKRIIEQLRHSGSSLELTRKLQKYTCTVKWREFASLKDQHAIDDFGTGIWCLISDGYYDKETGITVESRDYFL